MGKPLVLLVHHKPSHPQGYTLAHQHAQKVARTTGAEARALTIEEYTRKEQPPRAIVFAYIFLKGDHYEEIRRRSISLGHHLEGPIPKSITARGLCRKHSPTCGNLVLGYFPAPHNRARQEAELGELVGRVEETCRIMLTMVPVAHGGAGGGRIMDAGVGGCRDTLALFPTRRGDGGLIVHIGEELVGWVAGKLGVLGGKRF